MSVTRPPLRATKSRRDRPTPSHTCGDKITCPAASTCALGAETQRGATPLLWGVTVLVAVCLLPEAVHFLWFQTKPTPGYSFFNLGQHCPLCNGACLTTESVTWQAAEMSCYKYAETELNTILLRQNETHFLDPCSFFVNLSQVQQTLLTLRPTYDDILLAVTLKSIQNLTTFSSLRAAVPRTSMWVTSTAPHLSLFQPCHSVWFIFYNTAGGLTPAEEHGRPGQPSALSPHFYQMHEPGPQLLHIQIQGNWKASGWLTWTAGIWPPLSRTQSFHLLQLCCGPPTSSVPHISHLLLQRPCAGCCSRSEAPAQLSVSK